MVQERLPSIQYVNPNILETPPLLSSQETGWKGFYLEYHNQPAGETPAFVLNQCHLLCIETGQQSCGSRKWMDRHFRDETIRHGDVFVVPEQVFFREQWDGTIEYILLYLDADFVGKVAYEFIDPDRVEILPHFPQPDPLIYQVGLTLKQLLAEERSPVRGGAANRLYAETLGTTLAAHLLHHYAVQQPTHYLDSHKTAERRLRDVIDYIHNHFGQNLSLTELANQANMSFHHFAKSFKQATGLAPHQYIIQCRVDRAKELLRQRELSVAEIAHQTGFTDQSHLSRHFKRLVGATPKQWLLRS